MEENTRVPLLDLRKQYAQIKEEINQAIQEVLESQSFILGPWVEKFEAAVAAYLGVPYAIGVASGTDALLLSLMALGIKRNDQVIVPAYTFFSTASSVSRLGAKPVFLDIDPLTFNLDPQKLEDFLKKNNRKHPRPRAIIPVHLFGQMADMEAIMSLAHRFDLDVVEDAAQALGAKNGDWPAGTIGNLGCFSFYPSKNLGGYGDGGMVVTRDRELAARVRLLRVHGSEEKYYHRQIGICSRLDALQAAVLSVKLKYLNLWNEKRRKNAQIYATLFQEEGLNPPFVSLPSVQKGCYHIFNQFIVRARQRDELRQYLNRKGIGTEIYYPIPLHLQECYRSLGYLPGSLPESEKAARETIALPIYPELTLSQQRKVVQAIKDFYTSQRSPRAPRNTFLES
ncbi:MAG: DegT/DnrJ/EryC1/StrS family aminotransferase [Thermodesulfobacteriota bacterium]